MLSCVVVLFLAAVSDLGEFQTDKVSISVNIQSSIYTYQITNRNTSPMVSFEIPEHAAYNFIAPKDWKAEESEGIFKAWTDDFLQGIRSGEKEDFSMRVSSKGAVLGQVPAVIRFHSGESITVPAVWAPVAESRSYIFLVGGVILAIFVFHIWIIAAKQRKNK